jgi:hypothetical protein
MTREAVHRGDEIQGLLSDLDDNDEGLAENVFSDVVAAMDRAWEQLHDYSCEARGAEAITLAVEEMRRAVTRLTAVLQRLERLEALESGNAQSSRQAPRRSRIW